MDDPPPSYNSVVKEGLRQRAPIASDQEDKTPGSSALDDDSVNFSPSRQEYPPRTGDDSIQLGANEDSKAKTILPPRDHDEASQVTDQRLSLWDRIKKGFEDFAFFIIRIID